MTTINLTLPEGIRISLNWCIAMLLIASCDAGSAQREAADAGTAPVGSRDGVTVSAYCEKFAKRYSEVNALEYQERSARTEKRSDIMTWIANLFQPPDSRFTSEYDCRFRARRMEEHALEISVGIYLTRTRHFAEHTQWKDLQIIPIEYVVDEAYGRAGYGVFKYLEGL